MAVTTILNAAGFAFIFLGTWFAATAMYRETKRKQLSPSWIRPLERAEGWVRRVILRQKPVVDLHAHIEILGQPSVAVLGVQINRERLDDPVLDRLNQLEARLLELKNHLGHRVSELRRADEDLGREFRDWRDDFLAQQEETSAKDRETDSAVKNREGLGLLLVAVGSLLQGIATFV